MACADVLDPKTWVLNINVDHRFDYYTVQSSTQHRAEVMMKSKSLQYSCLLSVQ
jgi:hypothetical protein